VYNLTGNHDIGFRIGTEKQEALAEKFMKNFGPLNYLVRIGEFTFVGLNTVVLDKSPKMTSMRLRQDTLDFIEQFIPQGSLHITSPSIFFLL
jgi:hypothetical protein